jgi:hypothetical protein
MLNQLRTDILLKVRRVHGQGTDLGKIFPAKLQGTATDNDTVGFVIGGILGFVIDGIQID